MLQFGEVCRKTRSINTSVPPIPANTPLSKLGRRSSSQGLSYLNQLLLKMAKFVILIVAALAVGAYGHGRFIKPAGRSSTWRDPAFASQDPPVNYDDDSLYCGGLHQAEDPGSNCGVCGDPFSQSKPRDNEMGGMWYSGIITGQYSAGQEIDIEIDLTAAHLGNMEWRLCTNPQDETQACFNQHVLQLADGSGTKLPVLSGTGWYRTKARLPAGVTCEHCVIQWNYRAGNNWGECEDGSSDMGCGPQETFRGCADVSIS